VADDRLPRGVLNPRPTVIRGPKERPTVAPAGEARRAHADRDPPPPADVDRRRTLVFSSDDARGQYAINGALFDAARVNQVVRLGDVWEWTLRNADDDEHPFHIHVNHFEVVSGNGQPYDALGRQDTANFTGHGEVVVHIPFADYAGRFVCHCHILFHGDGGMMGMVEVRDDLG
jgi:suppressor of ftsI